LWLGGVSKKGYGQVNRRDRSGESETQAHRMAWELFRGPIPHEAHVLHKCDVRSCVNPDHLFLGDNVSNMADMVAKGRQRPRLGEASGMAKLTEADIKQIRADGRPNTHICVDYGVSDALIGMIKRRRIWRHVE
jgi:hypothetical protein